MKAVSEGAEAKIYEINIFGRDVLVKSREPKAYRIPEIDVSIRRTRTKKEAKILSRALQSGVKVPELIGVGATSIYIGKIEGVLLKDKEMTKGEASNAGRLLAELHNSGIVHGDFTPANIISDKGTLYLIDFGLAEITQSAEERSLDILLMKRHISKQLYGEFEKAYKERSRSAGEILSRLAEVEKRGRYQVRTLA